MGSPIIALKSLIEHQVKKNIAREVVFLFIETQSDRCKHLQKLLDNFQLPGNAKVDVINSKFDQTMTKVLDDIEQHRKKPAPCFVMIDPFGISETPMNVISRILSNPKSEVYISIMYNHINRFLGTSEFEPHLNQLFGCDEWKDANKINDTEQRQSFLFNLYTEQLKKSGAKYVLYFDLYQDNKHIYTIFFGTQSLKGCDKMKAAIWKVAPSGTFKYVGSKSSQLSFNLKASNFEQLKIQLQDEFIGKGFISIEAVLDFVSSDKTPYHSGQVKKNVLQNMEDDENPEIEIDNSTRRRRKTYPSGTKLRFLQKK